MPDLPQSRAGRKAKRAEIRDLFVAQAEQDARRARRSLVCAAGVNHSSCHGVTVCLCECHDPAATDG